MIHIAVSTKGYTVHSDAAKGVSYHFPSYSQRQRAALQIQLQAASKQYTDSTTDETAIQGDEKITDIVSNEISITGIEISKEDGTVIETPTLLDLYDITTSEGAEIVTAISLEAVVFFMQYIKGDMDKKK